MSLRQCCPAGIEARSTSLPWRVMLPHLQLGEVIEANVKAALKGKATPPAVEPATNGACQPFAVKFFSYTCNLFLIAGASQNWGRPDSFSATLKPICIANYIQTESLKWFSAKFQMLEVDTRNGGGVVFSFYSPPVR